jgi:replicative DNA helicase
MAGDVPRESPKALDAERALLGGLIEDPSFLHEISSIVRPEDFHHRPHREMFALIKKMSDANQAIDLVTIVERVRTAGEGAFGGITYVMDLPSHVPSTANLGYYAKLVQEKALLRALMEAAEGIAEEAGAGATDPSMLLEHAVRRVQEVGRGSAERTWAAIPDIVDGELKRIEELGQRDSGITGVTTGFRDLDAKLAGLQRTDLIILAARPAMGKTALALNFVVNAALMGGVGVGLFSLEMSRGQLVTRILCRQARVEGGKARTGQLGEDDWERMMDAAKELRTASIFIDDSPGITIGEVRARCRRLKASQPNLGLIVIDYLQLMQGDDPREPRQQQISNISRGLKILAKDLQVPVMALSQLNRAVEQRPADDRRPRTADLRESGAIEQDADVIMFIYRDEVYNPDTPDKGLAEVIIAKQRNGPTGDVKLVYQGNFTRFDDYLDEGSMFELPGLSL